ncbi:type II secretion system protein GspM [Pseudomonas sp. JV245A]|uniref:type II secretion system protein GspM n=1 Tax=Pseudomonas sp. JV245A TaxID=1890668 RepID=UPI0028E0C1A2|nr:type II secretion system protein GspM [Pseudomonas sp. JV245A]MDT9644397.1 type II secretion system protein M [Pseudomonas sp. JV245A]
MSLPLLKKPLSALLHPPLGHWHRLAKREQRALKGLTLFSALTGAYLLLWQPQQQALQLAEQRFIEATQLQRLILQLHAGKPASPVTAISAEALPGMLARSSSQAGISLERMDNEAPGRVSLALEGPLTGVIAWVDELEQKQVDVLAFSIEVNKDAVATVRMQVQAR